MKIRTKAERQRGSALVETVIAAGVLLLLATMVTGQAGVQAKMLGLTTKRVRLSSHVEGGLGVLSAWVGRASTVDILTDRSGGTAIAGSVLRLMIPGSGVAYASVGDNGLIIEASDGTSLVVAAYLRPPAAGEIFNRSVPTSPWDDRAAVAVPVLTDGFMGAGLVVVRYQVTGALGTDYARGLVNLGY
jgi:hypothetical protein